MKVLFVPLTISDGLEDVLYSGLNRISSIHVEEFPYKPIYHNFSHEGNNILTNTKTGRVDANPPWLLQSWNHNRIFREIGQIDFDGYDFVILGSVRDEARKYASEVIEKSRERLVFLDGEDDPFIRLLIRKSKCYFKREKFISASSFVKRMTVHNLLMGYYTLKKSLNGGIYSMPLPQIPPINRGVEPLNLTVLEHKHGPEVEKDIDVSLVARITDKARLRYSNALRSIAKRNNLSVYINTQGIPPSEYVNIIKRSKIALSLPGAGYDTFRYWEIPYYGTCLISLKLPIIIQDNFEHGYSGLFFNNEKELESSILEGLKNHLYEEIGKNGKAHFERYHTDRHRAEKLLSYLKDNS